eukprot:CAMPEP_0183300494 /NCGR_PEP_ID=MMETSP0160_2-20130417/6908_1 /TAXON_ID=2839 ORGANISM="Odontella Sinensis, Strain Grunow 1884" /NCGR_SAMPLE_ID=MMETSP0160_2 /ASSEMBLY_ACC=CAM_ASM_000250 /LENGTH=600 /DNA_ID=CAMNT_0025462933 /DNA_START=135 /DNA_END=1937 /DNA_ORIENTATION=-
MISDDDEPMGGNDDNSAEESPGGEEGDDENVASQQVQRKKGKRRAKVSSSSVAQSRHLHSCIVKLIVQSVTPNYAEPWRRKAQSSSAGTGFLVEGRRIVTNAHVVRRCTHVRARKSSSPVMFSCTVEWMSIPLDLAVLSVNDEDDFFGVDACETNSQNHLSLCRVLPRLEENVTCVGFPRGGQQISVTRGVVSRVDVNSHGVLRIQIDAAINPGNSGGPVFDERGRVVGVASSHLKGGSNIGYIIPVEVLTLFLSMCEDGLEASAIERSALNALAGPRDAERNVLVEMEGPPKMVPGVAGIGCQVQTLESKALRKRLGLMDEHGGGVRVSGIWSPLPQMMKGPSDGMNSSDSDDSFGVQIDDVLLSIDGVEVGQDGTIPLSELRQYERIGKSYLITRKRVGNEVELGMLRSGKPLTMKAVLRPSRYLCPVFDSFDAHPSYVVCGGCVFVPLSWPWISSYKKQSGFPSFNSVSSLPAHEDEQIIVLSKVLADEVNVGYHLKKWLILRNVNGKKPKNIRDLVRKIVEGGSDGAQNIEFRLYLICQEHNEQVICLDMDECKASEARILKQHMIASWCSDDAIPEEMKTTGADKMITLLENLTS